MRRTVWQVDPVNLTPYYDAALCRALVNAGWDVRRITSRYLYDDVANHVDGEYQTEYLYFPGLNHRRWRTLPRLRRVLRSVVYVAGHRELVRRLHADPPDVVHIQWSRMPTLDRWFVAQVQRCRIPVVHTVHDVEPLFSLEQSAELGRVLAMANGLVVHAEANRPVLLSRFPLVQDERIHVIPHIATPWTTPAIGNQTEARRQLGIPASVPVLLFFGTARPYKGLDILLDAYWQARRVCGDLWLVVVGEHSEKTLSGVRDDQIVSRHEYICSDDVWLYHRASDLAVFPYRQITQSGALVTAMGFGLPVIVSGVGGMPETVDGNGWIVPLSDMDRLAQVIVVAVQDRVRLRELGARSQQLIYERHSPVLIGAKTAALYDEVIRRAAYSLRN